MSQTSPEQPLQQILVQDVADDRGAATRAQLLVERLEVEADDFGVGVLGEVVDQPVADLAVGARDERDRFSQRTILRSG